MVIRRDFLQKIRPFVGLDVVKVATGIRRSGKSIFMQQVRDMIASEIDPMGKFVCVNLEEKESSHLLAKGVLHAHVLNEAKKNAPAKTYVFFDEISEVEEWEKTVNSLRVKKDIDLYVTGSVPTPNCSRENFPHT